MLTPQQRKIRKSSIGGSDAAALMGLHPYKTPEQLLIEKTTDDLPNIDNLFIRLGHYLEPFVIKEFEMTNGVKILQPKETFFHKDHKFLIAHVDGIIDQTGEIFEAKTCFSYATAKRFKDIGTDGVPIEYFMQCVHYMAVLDKPVVTLAALVFNQLKTYRIERSLTLESKYLEQAELFFEKIKLFLQKKLYNK